MSFEANFYPTDIPRWLAGLLAGDLGFISAYKDLPRIELLKMLGDLYNSTSNVTSADIAAVLKAPVDKVDLMKTFYVDAQHDFDFYAPYVANEVVPGLPHLYQGPAFVIVFSLLGFVTVLALAGRLYSRISIEGKIQLYDWIVVAAFSMAFCNGIMTSIVIQTVGKPRGNWDLTQRGHDAIQACYFAAYFLYSYGMLLVKVSILTFYYQLTTWRPLRWSVLATMVIVVLSTVVCTLLEVFKSKPVLQWTDRFGLHFVLVEASILLSQGIFLIVTDVLVWLLPLPLVWKLKSVKSVSRTDRWYAVIVFGLGMLVVIASIVRILLMRDGLEARNGIYPDDKLSIVQTIEALLAIICASFPALRALYNKYQVKFSMVVIPRDAVMADAGVGTDENMYMKGSIEKIRSREKV